MLNFGASKPGVGGGFTPLGSSGPDNAGPTNYSVPYKLVAFIGPFSTIVSYLK